MNVFLAGVHGVGKTFLAMHPLAGIGLTYASASKLIEEERAIQNWDADKRASDVDGNQIALATSVMRHNDAGRRLLLDGHFVLLNAVGEFTRLGSKVFKTLNVDGVVLLEADPYIIAANIRERDGREANIDHLVEFMATERTQAQAVCDELGIPLFLLEAPTAQAFAEAIATAAQKPNRACERNGVLS